MAAKTEVPTVRLTHTNGAVVSVSADKADRLLAGTGWAKAKGAKASTAAAAVDEPFNPGDHNVADVVAYLTDADDGERVRVRDAETAGKARVGITGWEPTPVGTEA